MALVDEFAGQDSDVTKSILEKVHPVYEANQQDWNLGLDAYDGSGGFRNGGYLWQFAREDADQFRARRAQARYHNYAETLVDIYIRNVTEGVTRETTDPGLEEWWANVDGRGTDMTSYVAGAFGQALAGGHSGVLVDRTREDVTGPSLADDPNRVLVSTFASTSITDWRTDREGLAAVKLREAPPTIPLTMDARDMEPGWLLLDRDSWVRFDHKGNLLSFDDHLLGSVPLVMIRPKPASRHPFIGKPLAAPSVIQALFNRQSEEDLVLRDQALSIFVVELPSDANAQDVEEAQTVLNAGVGTATAVVLKGQTDFRTADMQVPKTIREGQAMLVSELYRMAHLRFQRESLDAESAEAIRLQRQDLDQTLRSMAEDLTRTEEEIARLYFAWTTENPNAFDNANVEISYPRDFSLVNIEQELTAISLGIEVLRSSGTAKAELQQRAVKLVLPDLSDETLELITQEIENADQGVQSPIQAMRLAATERLRQQGVEIEEEVA